MRPDFKNHPYRKIPIGTRVRVIEHLSDLPGTIEAQTDGVIESWDDEPTGAWFAHGRHGKLWLPRLHLRKADGEESILVIDKSTEIHPLDEAGPDV